MPISIRPICIDCQKELCRSARFVKVLRCGDCDTKYRRSKIEWKYCLDCNKQLSQRASYYGYLRCKKCVDKLHSEKLKKMWQNEEFALPILKAQKRGLLVPQNKPEKLLGKLLGKDYKFVGNKAVFFGRFNPDFINCNGQKKIIEMYGDYWHNRKEWKARDKLRLKTYKDYGYETLIVWEKELKDLPKLINKIQKFNNENHYKNKLAAR